MAGSNGLEGDTARSSDSSACRSSSRNSSARAAGRIPRGPGSNNGMLAGKRAMLVVTTGGWESHYSPRGINGPIDDILFPIQHGILFYPGFDVLPPFVLYRASRIDDAAFSRACDTLGQRLDDLWKTAPIPFRRQNAGAYDVPKLTLRPNLAPGQRGFGIHASRE
ncbi:NAD(P)H quinone oxidoreductase (plasmid) [Azotobacter chroococcum NCIMB 8003]|uniref:NAD(P)H quinone oxidoreductase n=1 Tax=Azotobacter chroococcum NCIMB 8003 TaxID=1328314 RepID=A0A0C4WSD9_9GAMM|nr:NAD(P)H quinone oxidoreductase [Azotobacter chroococcum NCIMB 8003]